MDETTKKVLMIMLIILGVVFIAFGAIFNYSQKDAHDWESLGLGSKETVEEVEPEAYTPFSSQEDSSYMLPIRIHFYLTAGILQKMER